MTCAFDSAESYGDLFELAQLTIEEAGATAAQEPSCPHDEGVQQVGHPGLSCSEVRCTVRRHTNDPFLWRVRLSE